MARRKQDPYQTVPAAELRPRDRIRVMRPMADTQAAYYKPTPWVVLDPPVKLANTEDVSVYVGLRWDRRDHGISVRIPADEPVTITRD